MFRVHLRKKKISNDQLSLYLDFSRPVYHEIKDRNTRRHFLDLFIYAKPKTNIHKKHNTAMLEIAVQRQAEVLLAITNGTYGKRTASEKASVSFLDFMLERAALHKGTTRSTWINTYNHLLAFTKGSCTVGEITKEFLFNFKDYLSGLKLKTNTKRSYFSTMQQAVREAAERGLLNAPGKIKNFKSAQAARPFLREEQVTALQDTPWPKYPDARKAGLLSILTSLRWCDIIPLTYEQVQYDSKLGYYIDFKQKKVDRPDILYLSDEALEVMGYEKGKTGRIFNVNYWDKSKLSQWFALAGVEKPAGIEFHIFRHTFAMRALNRGEKIEVISAMMGHRDIGTTQIYAKLYAETKRDAAHRSTLRSRDG